MTGHSFDPHVPAFRTGSELNESIDALRNELSQGSTKDIHQNVLVSAVCGTPSMTIGIIAGMIGLTLLMMSVLGIVYVILRRGRVQKLNPKSEKNFQLETPNDKIKTDVALSA